MLTVTPYADENGHEPFAVWYAALKDRKVKQAVDRRMIRAELGQFGDCKPCRDGVWELRIDLGPGWRVYYALAGKTVVLLLCGGSKRTQDNDIARACGYWQDWQHRHHQAGDNI